MLREVDHMYTYREVDHMCREVDHNVQRGKPYEQ